MDNSSGLASPSRLFWVLAVLLLGQILGTAGQNFALLLCLCLAAFPRRWRDKSLWLPLSRSYRLIFYSFIALQVWMLLATCLNPKNLSSDIIANFLGYAPLAVLPWYLAGTSTLHDEDGPKLTFVICGLMIIWSLICLSQWIFAWKLTGTSIATAPLYARARGLYSHPLTLAYVALIIWPPINVYLMNRPRSIDAWIMAVGAGVLIGLSQSRMVQLLLAACVLFNILVFLRGRGRVIVLASVVAVGSVIAFTNNPITKRFSAPGTKIEKTYADDRVVFWHAHWEMIKDRPILGHGIHLDADYRRPYYERIGQGTFPKQYEAHNQFIQIMAEGGSIGILLFALWIFGLWCFLRRFTSLVRNAGRQTIVFFLLGGMTQNSFFDSEVRYAILMMLTLLLVEWKTMQTSAEEPEL